MDQSKSDLKQEPQEKVENVDSAVVAKEGVTRKEKMKDSKVNNEDVQVAAAAALSAAATKAKVK